MNANIIAEALKSAGYSAIEVAQAIASMGIKTPDSVQDTQTEEEDTFESVKTVVVQRPVIERIAPNVSAKPRNVKRPKGRMTPAIRRALEQIAALESVEGIHVRTLTTLVERDWIVTDGDSATLTDKGDSVAASFGFEARIAKGSADLAKAMAPAPTAPIAKPGQTETQLAQGEFGGARKDKLRFATYQAGPIAIVRLSRRPARYVARALISQGFQLVGKPTRNAPHTYRGPFARIAGLPNGLDKRLLGK